MFNCFPFYFPKKLWQTIGIPRGQMQKVILELQRERQWDTTSVFLLMEVF